MAEVVEETAQIHSVEEALARQFEGTVDRSVVQREVRRSMSAFADARVRTFVPVLVQRLAAQALRAQGGTRA
jgi:hypothetical protein